MDILVIPDSHSHPKVSNRRFTWLGNFITVNRPEVIVDIGDFIDFQSISKYNDAKEVTLEEELACARDANQKAFGEIPKLKKHYSPKLIRTVGNHEGKRILEHNVDNSDPLSVNESLAVEGVDTRIVPFLKPIILSRIAFCHYFYDRTQQYAIGSAERILSSKHMSCISGHTHVRDYAESVRADGVRLQSVVVGCFLDPDKLHSTYMGPQSADRWWSGLVWLKDVTPKGEFDLEFISVKRLQRLYG